MVAKAPRNGADRGVPDGECFLASVPEREYARRMFSLLFRNENWIFLRRTLMKGLFGAFAVCFCLCSCEDPKKNLENCHRRAEQGESAFQTLLGFTYLDGAGVPKDVTEALKWFHKAAGQGDVTAQSKLGSMYYYGKEVPKDDTEAVKWYRMAAGQGDNHAQSSLAHMYFLHRGVTRDDVTNYKWALLASSQEKNATEKTNWQVMIDSLENSMTPEQRAEGQRMASEFKPTKQTP